MTSEMFVDMLERCSTEQLHELRRMLREDLDKTTAKAAESRYQAERMTAIFESLQVQLDVYE